MVECPWTDFSLEKKKNIFLYNPTDLPTFYIKFDFLKFPFSIGIIDKLKNKPFLLQKDQFQKEISTLSALWLFF